MDSRYKKGFVVFGVVLTLGMFYAATDREPGPVTLAVDYGAIGVGLIGVLVCVLLGKLKK